MANLPVRWRLGLRAVAPLAVALLAAVLVSPVPASAQSLSEVEAEIEDKWRELEPLIEDYNRVRSELKKNREASEELAEKIQPMELQASLASEELNDIAVEQYKQGPMSSIGALVTSGSPVAFVERLTALDQLARQQQQRMDEAGETLASYEAQKAEIDALIAKQEEQKADLADRTESIEADIEELEQLQDQAQQASDSTTVGEEQPSGSCPAVDASGPGAVAAEFACAQIGKPYVYGAGGPGSYDCSGLTSAAWAAAGVSLTHYTGAQWNEGSVVDRSELVPGDLVFYYSDLSHVGVYVGGGMIVDAPNSGSSVSMRSMDTMPIAGFRRPG